MAQRLKSNLRGLNMLVKCIALHICLFAALSAVSAFYLVHKLATLRVIPWTIAFGVSSIVMIIVTNCMVYTGVQLYYITSSRLRALRGPALFTTIGRRPSTVVFQFTVTILTNVELILVVSMLVTSIMLPQLATLSKTEHQLAVGTFSVCVATNLAMVAVMLIKSRSCQEAMEMELSIIATWLSVIGTFWLTKLGKPAPHCIVHNLTTPLGSSELSYGMVMIAMEVFSIMAVFWFYRRRNLLCQVHSKRHFSKMGGYRWSPEEHRAKMEREHGYRCAVIDVDNVDHLANLQNADKSNKSVCNNREGPRHIVVSINNPGAQVVNPAINSGQDQLTNETNPLAVTISAPPEEFSSAVAYPRFGTKFIPSNQETVSMYQSVQEASERMQGYPFYSGTTIWKVAQGPMVAAAAAAPSLQSVAKAARIQYPFGHNVEQEHGFMHANAGTYL